VTELPVLSALAVVNGYAVSARTTGLPYRDFTSAMTLYRLASVPCHMQ
jgi:hypothetical protein